MSLSLAQTTALLVKNNTYTILSSIILLKQRPPNVDEYWIFQETKESMDEEKNNIQINKPPPLFLMWPFL